MTVAALAAAAAFGVVGGVLAGLIGIGGGAVLVPFLYLLFEHPAWSGVTVPAERITLVAHATSLVVIVPTALSALRTFGRAQLVPWRIALPMGAAAAVAALLATRIAPELPDALLRGGFAAFLTAVGLRLLTERAASGPAQFTGREHPWAGIVGGVAVGVFSALLGVGGGLLAIPVLLYGFRVDMRRVAAASMGVVAFAAVAGAIGYLAADAAMLPAGSVGWVFLPAALALAPGAVLGAHWGARLNQRLGVRVLRRVFALFFLALGIELGWSAFVRNGDVADHVRTSAAAGAVRATMGGAHAPAPAPIAASPATGPDAPSPRPAP